MRSHTQEEHQPRPHRAHVGHEQSWPGPILVEEGFSQRGKAHLVSKSEPVLFMNFRELASLRNHFCECFCFQLCPVGMMDCCKVGCWIPLYFRITILCTNLLLLIVPVWGGESAEKPAVQKECFWWKMVWCLVQVCVPHYWHSKDSVINKHNKWSMWEFQEEC